MSTANGIQGLAETYSLFDRIPVAAQHQLADELGRIGRDVLAAEKADVAKDTHALEQGLSLQLLTDQLRVRIGLLGLSRRSKLFYGRVVEFGRRAQVVIVQRRRRVNGKLRTQSSGSRKRVTDIAATYSMKVKALPARHYVQVDRPEIAAEQRLANFWSQVLSNAGAAA